jgi:hypothetical protein
MTARRIRRVWHHRPHEAEKLTGSGPFHDDATMTRLVDALCAVWDRVAPSGRRRVYSSVA